MSNSTRALGWIFALVAAGCATGNMNESDTRADGSAEAAADGSMDARADASRDVRTDAVLDVHASDAPSGTDSCANCGDATDACHASCSGRTCGSDGCGGSCGSCGTNQTCNASGQCVSSLPECGCFYGECTSCYCASGVSSYASSHSCQVSVLSGHTGDLLSCTGGTWSVGTTCSNGCTVAPPMVPDYCNPPPGGHHLYIAFDSSVSSCHGTTESYFQCIFPHTNFNALATTFSSGRSMSYGAAAVLSSNCSFVHSTSATISQDSATLQCIENQTHWPLSTDDIVLYYPSYSGCSDGRNHWHIPVSVNGASVSVEMGFGFTGSSCSCQQALGTHEVYEAAAQYNAADCCNGQDGCAANPAPYGWYTFSACGATWTAQTLSTQSGLFSSNQCQRFSVH